ncbi:MAG TPA: OsmC family protein [Chloroflexota bacterium]
MTSVRLRTVGEGPLGVGWAGPRTLTFDRPADGGGRGLGFNGGELLLLAVGACCSNDLFREAAKLGITLRSVEIEVTAEWGGDPARAQSISYRPLIDADASPEQIRQLLEHTDRVAEIPNSLRHGAEVRLVQDG